MHSFDQILEDIKYSVFFFSTFTGLTHPLTPQHPIDLEEIYNPQRRTYYLAWYVDEEPGSKVKKIGTKEDTKLVYLEKFWIRFTDFPAPDDIASQPDTYFHSITRDNSGVKIEPRIDASASLSKTEFYMYRINENGNLTGSWIVRRGLMDKYSYSYKPNGTLADVKVDVLDLPEN